MSMSMSMSMSLSLSLPLPLPLPLTLALALALTPTLTLTLTLTFTLKGESTPRAGVKKAATATPAAAVAAVVASNVNVALKAKKNARPNPVDVDESLAKQAKLAEKPKKPATRKRGEVAAAAASSRRMTTTVEQKRQKRKVEVEQKRKVEQKKRKECEQLEAEIAKAEDERDYPTCESLTRGLVEAMRELDKLQGELKLLEEWGLEHLREGEEPEGAGGAAVVEGTAVVEDDDNSHGQQGGATVLAARSEAVQALKVFEETAAAADELLGQETAAVHAKDYTGAATLKTEHDTKLGLCSVQAKAAKAAIDRHSNLLAEQREHRLSALHEALRKEECAVQDMVSKLPWHNDGEKGLEARLAMVRHKIGEVEMALQPLRELEQAMQRTMQTMQKEKTAASEHEESWPVPVNPEIARVMKRFLPEPSMPNTKRAREAIRAMTPKRRNVDTGFQLIPRQSSDEVEVEVEVEEV